MPAQAARKIAPEPISGPKSSERKSQPKLLVQPRLFHARMLVTRVEEWCVEAETAEEARALLASGAGHRCTPGDSVQIEVETLLED